MPWVDDHHAATRSLEHVAIAQDRKTGIERHVAVTAEEDAQNGGESIGASAREDACELRRGAARISRQQQARDSECAAVQFAVRECCACYLERRPFGEQGDGAEKAHRERSLFP